MKPTFHNPEDQRRCIFYSDTMTLSILKHKTLTKILSVWTKKFELPTIDGGVSSNRNRYGSPLLSWINTKAFESLKNTSFSSFSSRIDHRSSDQLPSFKMICLLKRNEFLNTSPEMESLKEIYRHFIKAKTDELQIPFFKQFWSVSKVSIQKLRFRCNFQWRIFFQNIRCNSTWQRIWRTWMTQEHFKINQIILIYRKIPSQILQVPGIFDQVIFEWNKIWLFFKAVLPLIGFYQKRY